MRRAFNLPQRMNEGAALPSPFLMPSVFEAKRNAMTINEIDWLAKR